MRIATLDIETIPSRGYMFQLFNQNFSLNQVTDWGEVVCFASKWHGEKKTEFYSTHKHGKDEMVAQAHRIMTEADAIVTYNGISFDMKWLNTEIALQGMTPPPPYKNIDLLRAVKKNFRFTSNKLEHVAQQMLGETKLATGGFDLWLRVMQNDEKAWRLFEKYNRRDVVVTEKLYDKLLPWLPNHPHPALYSGSEDDCCQRCGGTELERRGYAYTPLGKYQQYKCGKCGAWSRGKKALATVDARGI